VKLPINWDLNIPNRSVNYSKAKPAYLHQNIETRLINSSFMTNLKIALVVGASDGIGRQTAIDLHQLGYKIIAVGRNIDKLNALKASLQYCDIIPADISLMKEVTRVATIIQSSYPRLDVILYTADVLLTKRKNTSEGNELAFATNYLSRYLLNSLLIEQLNKSETPRIIHVSVADFPATLKKENFPVKPSDSSMTGHNLGQLCNDFYGVTFAQKYPAIKINILNPGIVKTKIFDKMEGGILLKTGVRLVKLLFLPRTTTIEQYVPLVVNIALGKHAPADEFVLIDRKGKGIVPKKDRLDKDLQEYVWNKTAGMVKYA
jgi:NAD(P)-dependent dehydrogenase (short-subunit alcohol dehydrogenase family)